MPTLENLPEAGKRALDAASQLEKIKFVDFTVGLVQGVYEVITKASMSQLEAYSKFVNSVSKSLKEYQDGLIGPDDSPQQQENIKSYIKNVLALDPEATDYSLSPEKVAALKEHFAEVTIEEGEPVTKKDISAFITPGDPDSTLKADDLKRFVLEKLKDGAKNSQELLKTILKIGMQKVVVTNGEIMTRLTFHIDASDRMSKESDRMTRESSGWGVGGSVSGGVGIVGQVLGGSVGGSLFGGYSSRTLNVSIVNEKSSSATNINVDVLGLVKINFRTESFPSIDV